MVVLSLSGNRCQGLYRGSVLLHLPHGRLKVFVFGIYDESYMTHPELLPICELITPLWGGTFNGNGSFSYPNIGSTVWVQFANEDVNYPVVIGATLGGENAYNLYRQIEEISTTLSVKNGLSTELSINVDRKHMFTTGMSHFLMDERGKISSYVQQPFDNNVTVDFSNGDILCEVNDDIAQKIENNEISHIVCLSVLDNLLDKGEISNSTHFYDPYSYNNSYFLSDTQEAFVSNLNRETSSINYSIKNNIGDIIDNQLCTLTNSELFVYSNLNELITKLSTLDKKDSFSNIETTNITCKKNLNLAKDNTTDIIECNTDVKNNIIQLHTYNYKNNSVNNIENKVNGNHNINIANNENTNDILLYYDNKLKLLSTWMTFEKFLNESHKNIDSYGIKECILENSKKYDDIYSYINDTTKTLILSTKLSNQVYDGSEYLNNSSHLNELLLHNKMLSNYGDTEVYLKISPSESIISTYKNDTNSDIGTKNTKLFMSSNILNTEKTLSTKIDILKEELTTYDSNITDNITNKLDIDKNICLLTQSLTNILSTFILPAIGEMYNYNDTYTNEINIKPDSIILNNISTNDFSDVFTTGAITTNNLTSTNKLGIYSNNTTELFTEFINNKNNIQLSTKHFVLSGDANCESLLELVNYEDFSLSGVTKTIIDKQAKLLMFANSDKTKILLKAKDEVSLITCETDMDLDNKYILTYIENDNCRCDLKMDIDNEVVTLKLDGSDVMTILLGNGKMTLKSSGEIELRSDSETKIVSSGKTTLLAPLLDIIANDALNINTNGTCNIAGEIVFTKPAYFKNGTYSTVYNLL